MPYSEVKELPEETNNLPLAAKRIWLAAFNAAYARYSTDEQAIKVAWGAVKAKYKKKGDGWVGKRTGKANGENILLSVSARTDGPATCVGFDGTEFIVYWTQQAIGLNDGVGIGGDVAANHDILKGQSDVPIGVLLDSRAYGDKLIQENYIFDQEVVEMILSEKFCKGVSIEADKVVLAGDQIMSAKVTGNSFIFFPAEPALPPSDGGKVYRAGELLKGSEPKKGFAHIIMGEKEIVSSINIPTEEEMKEASTILGHKLSYAELEELTDESFLLLQDIGGEIVRRFPVVDVESAELAAEMIDKAFNLEKSEKKSAMDKLKEVKAKYGIASKKVNDMSDELKKEIATLTASVSEKDKRIAVLEKENKGLGDFKVASEKATKDEALKVLGEYVEDTTPYEEMKVKNIKLVAETMKKIVVANREENGLAGGDVNDTPAEGNDDEPKKLSVVGEETPEEIKALLAYNDRLLGRKPKKGGD